MNKPFDFEDNDDDILDPTGSAVINDTGYFDFWVEPGFHKFHTEKAEKLA